MEYMGFIFGIFGFLAYIELSSLKGRVSNLESQLSHMHGSFLQKERLGLAQGAKSCIGKPVRINLKENYADLELATCSSKKSGNLVILDADQDWLLLRISSPKGDQKKLIRIEALQSLSPIDG